MRCFVIVMMFMLGLIMAINHTPTSAQEKKKGMLAKEFSSPFTNVVFKPQKGVFKLGSKVRGWEKEGKTLYVHHLGEDFLIEAGTPVLAVADGYIVLNLDVPGTPERPQWGGIIVIEHVLNKEGVTVYTIYGHIERNESLKPGSVIRRGKEIGKVAKSKTPQNGHWDVDPHLHLQLMLDPLGKYRKDEVPKGMDHIRDRTVKEVKFNPFPAPYRLADHMPPSEAINAKDPVAVILKERVDPKRRQ